MLARVTTFEGGTADGVRAAGDDFRSRVESGPPEGVKSNGVTMLADPEGGRMLVIGLFATEEDLRQSEAALEAMEMPQGLGTRASVEVFEVVADVRA
jgi:hypothetical protein